jgi:GNAT superfamily N-acetyltransferase
MGIEIRHLTEADLAFANSVREIAGWNQTPRDWRRFISLEPEGCFLAEIDGPPAGTATTTCYGTDLAWIGMVLVHPDFRRRGVGTALLEHCIRHLRETRGIRCVKLDATPQGQPLYEKLGFQAEWVLRRWCRPGGEEDAGMVGRGGAGTLEEEHFRLDREVFGADRRRLLESLSEGGMAKTTTDDGFGLMRKGARANYIGPVSAENDAAGREILEGLIDLAPAERMIFIDLPDANASATKLLKSRGFEPIRVLTRMFLGENEAAGDPLRMFGIAEPGLG